MAETYFAQVRPWYESYAAELPRQCDAPGRLRCPLRQGGRGPRAAGAGGREISFRGGLPGRRPDRLPAGDDARSARTLESAITAPLEKTHRPAPLLVGLAEVQAALGRLLDSEAIYREILAKNPADDAACNNLALILALQGSKLDEALELVDKVIERVGPQGAFLDTRAVVLIARHEPRPSLADLDTALAERSTPLPGSSTRPGPCLKTAAPTRPRTSCKRPAPRGWLIPCSPSRNATSARGSANRRGDGGEIAAPAGVPEKLGLSHQPPIAVNPPRIAQGP